MQARHGRGAQESADTPWMRGLAAGFVSSASSNAGRACTPAPATQPVRSEASQQPPTWLASTTDKSSAALPSAAGFTSMYTDTAGNGCGQWLRREQSSKRESGSRQRLYVNAHRHCGSGFRGEGQSSHQSHDSTAGRGWSGAEPCHQDAHSAAQHSTARSAVRSTAQREALRTRVGRLQPSLLAQPLHAVHNFARQALQ